MSHDSYIQEYRQKPIPNIEAVRLQVSNFDEVVTWIESLYDRDGSEPLSRLMINRILGEITLATPGNSRTKLTLGNYLIYEARYASFRVMTSVDFHRVYEVQPEDKTA